MSEAQAELIFSVHLRSSSYRFFIMYTVSIRAIAATFVPIMKTSSKLRDIDNNKYMEFMESTLDQITSSLGIDFDEILGKPKQTGIEDFFY